MGRFCRSTSTHRANQFIRPLVIGCVSPCKCTRLCVLLTLCFVAVGLPALHHHHSAIPLGMSSGFSKKQSAILEKTIGPTVRALCARGRQQGTKKHSTAAKKTSRNGIEGVFLDSTENANLHRTRLRAHVGKSRNAIIIRACGRMGA